MILYLLYDLVIHPLTFQGIIFVVTLCMYCIIICIMIGIFVVSGLLHWEMKILALGLTYLYMFPTMFLFLVIFAFANLHDLRWGVREKPTMARARVVTPHEDYSESLNNLQNWRVVRVHKGKVDCISRAYVGNPQQISDSELVVWATNINSLAATSGSMGLYWLDSRAGKLALYFSRHHSVPPLRDAPEMIADQSLDMADVYSTTHDIDYTTPKTPLSANGVYEESSRSYGIIRRQSTLDLVLTPRVEVKDNIQTIDRTQEEMKAAQKRMMKFRTRVCICMCTEYECM